MVESGTEKVILCSGEEMEVFDGENGKDIRELCNWSKMGYIKSVKGNRIFPKGYLTFDKKLYNFSFRPTDVFINGFLKSGTTWLQEIVWTMLHNPKGENPLKEVISFIKAPWFENDVLPEMGLQWYRTNISKIYNISLKPHLVDLFEELPNRRIFKTHMYSSTVNPNMFNVSKMVYIIRSPMDACYSFYFTHRWVEGTFGFTKDWQEFADVYTRGELFNGNSAEHILSWWPYRNHGNIHFIYYENMKEDLTREIRKLSKFLEVDLNEEEIKNVIRQTSFNKMKAEFETNLSEMTDVFDLKQSDEQSSFFRKGVVGDSKNMPKDVYNKIAAYSKESLNDLELPYDFSAL